MEQGRSALHVDTASPWARGGKGASRAPEFTCLCFLTPTRTDCVSLNLESRQTFLNVLLFGILSQQPGKEITLRVGVRKLNTGTAAIHSGEREKEGHGPGHDRLCQGRAGARQCAPQPRMKGNGVATGEPGQASTRWSQTAHGSPDISQRLANRWGWPALTHPLEQSQECTAALGPRL